jgi:hypothetical protein
MPFLSPMRRVYNHANVEALRENQSGVYGLLRGNVWVYVGKGDIRKRLLDHLNDDNPRITAERPTHWMDEVTARMYAREKELIKELNPVVNQRLG